ncbi:hypothetical protein BH10PLA1_BH10PLA1_01540 [soil metagenome]
MALPLVAGLGCLAGQAAASTWTSTGNGNWSDPLNWTGGVPDAAGADANLATNPGNATLGTTITIDGFTRTVGSIEKATSNKYTIAATGNGTLAFNTGNSSVATITQTISGNNKGLLISAPMRLDSSLSINNGTTESVSLSGQIDMNGRTLTIIGSGSGGVVLSGNLTGAGNIIQNSSNSVLTLGGDNQQYSGNYTVSASTSMSLSGGTGNVINNVANIVTIDGSLKSDANSITLAGLIGAATGLLTRTDNGGTGKTIKLAGSGSYTYLGAITRTGSGGTLGLNKTGNGTQVFGGALSYNGATAVGAGTMLINGTLQASSGVAVSSGATLGGNGTIGTSTFGVGVSVASGGTLAPGSGGVGTLATGNLTLSSGSHLQIEYDTTTNTADKASVTGNVSLNGAILELSHLPANTTINPYNHTFVLIDNDGGDAIVGTLTGTGLGTRTGDTQSISFAALQATLYYAYDSLNSTTSGGNDLAIRFTSVPEPGTGCLAVFAGAGWLLKRRRRVTVT